MSFFKSAYGKIGLMLILLLTVMMALFFGSSDMSVAEFIGGIFKREGFETESLIIYSLRLPRITGAIIAGAGLSVSGVLLQAVTDNKLASPNIIGVNSGAGLAVILTMYLFPTAVFGVSIAAFVGAFLTTLFITAVAEKIGMGKSTIILVGVAVTALLNAGISFMSYLDSDLLVSYNCFSVGGLSSVKTEALITPFLIVVISIIAAYFLGERINTLSLGDSIALSLGVDVKRLRIICLIISSACAGAVVSFAGLLGFIGLVVPHTARKLTGNDTKELVVVSAISGAVLTVAADLFSRTAFSPSEIPLGIVMAFIGAPFFFSLIIFREGKEC